MYVPRLFTKTVLTVPLRLGPGLIVVLHFDHCGLQFGRLTCSRLRSEQRENKTERAREQINGKQDEKETVLYSPSPVWHLVRSLRTELRLHTAESPGWALWTAPPHLEEGSHNDLDHLQEGGCSNHKTTAVYFFNALVDTVVSGPLISVQQLILTTKLCSLVYTHST